MGKKKKKAQEEYEEVDGEFLEVDLENIAMMMVGTAHPDSKIVIETDSKEGKSRFWLPTPMGYREVDRFYVRLTDTICEQEVDGTVN